MVPSNNIYSTNYHGGPYLIGPMVYIKTYRFNHFY